MRKKTQQKHLLKLISLVFGFTLWLYVLNSEPVEVVRSLPLYLIKPPGLAVNVKIPRQIKVTFKGPRSFMNDLELKGKRKVFVNLKDYPKKIGQSFNINLEAENVSTPFGVEVISIEPSAFSVSYEKEIRKKVPIVLSLAGELPDNLRLLEKRIEPRNVMISGPRSVLKKIGKLDTRPVDLTILDGEGKMAVDLETVDSRVKLEDLKDVSFFYAVKPNQANMTLKNIPINFMSSRLGIKSKIRLVALDVLVPRGKEDSLRSSQVKVLAEIPSNKRGYISVKLKAELPDGIHLLRIHPESINVLVK